MQLISSARYLNGGVADSEPLTSKTGENSGGGVTEVALHT